MAHPPTFFFSYDRQDASATVRFRDTGASRVYVNQFFQDLELRVAMLSGHNLAKLGPLGTKDDRDVQLGMDWDLRLSGALERCSVLVANISPGYFTGENCGKEFGAFVLRSPRKGIDCEGQLIGVENVLIIRWLSQESYSLHGIVDGWIPKLIRRINYAPPKPGVSDQELKDAIERYLRKGMESCVDCEPYYRELLGLFARWICDAPALPPSTDQISWANAPHAFQHNWGQQFGVTAPDVFPVTLVPPQPSPLSAAVFYLTRRELGSNPAKPTFADRLISEPPSEDSHGQDIEITSLLSNVRRAAHDLDIAVVHCAEANTVPITPDLLLSHLRDLTARRVLTVVIADPAFLATAPSYVQLLAENGCWHGPVLVPDIRDTQTVAMPYSMRRAFHRLSADQNVRMTEIRSVLLGLRQFVYTEAASTAPPVAKTMPILNGVQDVSL